MRKKPLDMIPFVDIMIVVLFIFATIEEGETGAVAKLDKLQTENEDMHAKLAGIEAGRVKAELERDEMKEAVEASKQPIAQGLEASRQKEVIGALLGEAQVIEVEISKRITADAVFNPCCYRRFSLNGAWRACGEVPTGAADRTRWLDDGAGGLLDELNATGATPTMVLIRQEGGAAYNIGDKLGDQIRKRTPIKKTYSVTVKTPVERCGAPGDEPPATSTSTSTSTETSTETNTDTTVSTGTDTPAVSATDAGAPADTATGADTSTGT